LEANELMPYQFPHQRCGLMVKSAALLRTHKCQHRTKSALYTSTCTNTKRPEGHDECASSQVALETCSFSKFAGFTGVRLGWTVVPAALKYSDGTPVRQDWNRVMSTCFNGASNVAQAGGLACVSDAGMAAMWELVAYYKVRSKPSPALLSAPVPALS
jgi:hypothetical protein